MENDATERYNFYDYEIEKSTVQRKDFSSVIESLETRVAEANAKLFATKKMVQKHLSGLGDELRFGPDSIRGDVSVVFQKDKNESGKHFLCFKWQIK